MPENQRGAAWWYFRFVGFPMLVGSMQSALDLKKEH